MTENNNNSNDEKNIRILIEFLGIDKLPRSYCLILIQALTQRLIELEKGMKQ